MTRTVLGRVLNLRTAAILPFALLLSPCNSVSSSRHDVREPSQRNGNFVIDHDARLLHARELIGEQKARILGAESALVAAAMREFIESQTAERLQESDKSLAPAIANAIVREAARYKMDPLFLLAVVAHESRFRVRAQGRHGEIGLMQIKPSTAEWISQRLQTEWRGADSLYDPQTNIQLATAYFAWLRGNFGKRAVNYVAAYNMDPVNVRRLRAENVVPYIYADEVIGKYHDLYRKLVSHAEGERQFTVSMATHPEKGQVVGQISN